MIKTIQDCIARFELYRERGWLKQHVWDRGNERACALGAFFGAGSSAEAQYQNKCTNNILPGWLIQLTPGMFDRQATPDANAWATRVYGRDGLVDRASLLDRGQRDIMWRRSKQLADEEVRTNKCIKREFGNLKTFGAVWTYYAGDGDTVAKLAGTLLDCIDQALTEAGV